jgi:hypothetical protein
LSASSRTLRSAVGASHLDSAEAGALIHVEHERIMTAVSMLPVQQGQVLILRYGISEHSAARRC